jgi:PERQ amino acid-rich with GYF domain-containing protein
MPPGYCRVSDEDEDGPFRSGQEVSAVVDTSRQLEISGRSGFLSRLDRGFSVASGILERVISGYVTLNCRWYGAFLVWFHVLALSIGTTAYSWKHYPPTVDITLGSFEIPDQRVSREYDGLQAAIDWGKKHNSLRTRAARSTRCSIKQQGCPAWKVDIVYLPIGGGEDPDNIFTKERISDIHSIEMKIMQDTEYQNFCWKRDGVCTPINSLLTYFYPSERNGQVVFDGLGSAQEPVETALRKAASNPNTYWYVDDQFGKHNKKSRLLRSEVTLGQPLPGSHWFSIRNSKNAINQSNEASDYMISLIPLLEKATTKRVKVLYGGGSIYDYEVEQAVQHDSKLAIASLCLIALLVFILTSMSAYLTITGILCVAESFPFTYIIYRTWFDIPTVGILNIISLFVIVGIGVDDVFVFINTFRLAHQYGNDVRARLVYTIKTAGLTTMFTSVTTATAFFANVPSQLPAIHDFGLFMGVLVVMCYLITVMTMPAILYIWWLSGTPESPLIFQVLVFGANDALVKNQPRRSVRQESDDASYGIPMGVMPMDIMNDCGPPLNAASNQEEEEEENEDPFHLGESSTDFDAIPDHELLWQQIAETGQCKCIDNTTNYDFLRYHMKENPKSPHSYLQNFISKYLSKWIVNIRIILFILYIIAFCVSLGLVSNMRTADKPPQFFPSDSNIQQLIDISYNLTDSDNSKCWECSGYFTPAEPIQHSTKNTPTKSKPATNAPTHARTELPVHHTAHQVTPELPHKTTTKIPKQVAGTTSISRTEMPTYHHRQVTTKPATESTPRQITQERKTPQVPEITHLPPPQTNPVNHPSPIIHHPITNDHHDQPIGVQSTSTPPRECASKSSCVAADRPASGNNALVFIVFGIKDIDRSEVISAGHVIPDDLGEVVWDKQFQDRVKVNKYTHTLMTDNIDESLIQALCDICVEAQNPSRKLVVSNGADCFSSTLQALTKFCKQKVDYEVQFQAKGSVTKTLKSEAVPEPTTSNSSHTYIKWMSMAFLSTTYKGMSSFDSVEYYNKWNDFLKEMKDKHGDVAAIQNAYQTSKYWVDVFREVIAVTSAIYGIILSIVLCMGWVAIFTGHIWLVLIVFASIAGTLLTVLSLIYVIGWKFGAVEAITLSVLVGTSVDYIVHLVESFVLSGKGLKVRESNPNRDVRNRVRWGISHIGISIFSSALTTVVASIPLCLTKIQLFAKFGQILLLNTGMSILYAFTACAAMLAIFAGLRCCCLRLLSCYSCKHFVIALLILSVLAGLAILGLHIAYEVYDKSIPGPDGLQPLSV